MIRCDKCYGDTRGECIRAGSCIMSRKLTGPTKQLLSGLFVLAVLAVWIVWMAG